MDESGETWGITENRDGVERELKQEEGRSCFPPALEPHLAPRPPRDNSAYSLRSTQSTQVGMPTG